MEWDRVLAESVNNGEIRELHLRKIPALKTCDTWDNVKEIGLVDYKTRFTHLKGGLVKYGERIFFVSDARLEALAPYRNWNFKTKLKVLPEKAPKKK